MHHFTRTEGKSPEQAISKDDFVAFGGFASGAIGDGAGEVWAAAEARVNETIAASNVDCTSLVKTTPWDQRDHETGVSRCVLQQLMVIAIAPTNENRES